MALECNIDAAGKAARLMGGIAAVAGGTIMLAIAGLGALDGTIWWLLAGGALAGGAFSLSLSLSFAWLWCRSGDDGLPVRYE